MAWIFDAGSTYFYHQATEFYYEPKSKLYCKRTPDQQYVWYQHAPDQDPPYVAMTPSSTSTSSAPASSAQNAEASASAPSSQDLSAPQTSEGSTTSSSSGTVAATPGVATSAKPVSFGLPKSKAPKSMSINAKKQAKEIAKWGNRQREMVEPDQPTQSRTAGSASGAVPHGVQAAGAPPQATPIDLHKYAPASGANSTSAPAGNDLEALALDYQSLPLLLLDGKPIVKSSKGKWACLVSRRVFAAEDQLQKHIQQSSLYREELAKAIRDGRISRATG